MSLMLLEGKPFEKVKSLLSYFHSPLYLLIIRHFSGFFPDQEFTTSFPFTPAEMFQVLTYF